MKLEIVLGILLVIALIGFFVYEFNHTNQTQTTYYTSRSTSTGLFGLFPRSPLSQQNLAATGTISSGGASPYAPYQGYSGTAGVSPYAPYASYNAASSTMANNPANLLTPFGFTLADASPYFGQVRFGLVGHGYNNTLTVTLGANIPGNQKVNITGWQIKANHGGVFIPQAISNYDSSGNETDSDIVLGNGDQVTLYSTQSPIGDNLRLNKCIGYIDPVRSGASNGVDTRHTFQPSLPSDCPTPLIPQVQTYSPVCQDYIASLGSCQQADTGISLPFYDSGCRDYLATINYKGCHARWAGISGFFEPYWWVWTGSNFVDPRHDKVLLLDKQGKIVDVYAY